MNTFEEHSFVVIDRFAEPPSPFQNFDDKPKTRTTRACQSCKNSHVSCGIERPCQRCVRAGKADLCVDTVPGKRGRKRQVEEGTTENVSPTSEMNFLFSNQVPPSTPLEFNVDTSPVQFSRSCDQSPGSNNSDSTSSDGSSFAVDPDLPENFTALMTKLVVERGWMTKKEWLHNQAGSSSIIRRREDEKSSWTEEKRTQYKDLAEKKKLDLIKIASDNPAPMVVRNHSHMIVYANDAFKELTGIPDEVGNSVIESLKTFYFSSETIRVLAWSRMTKNGQKHVAPCHLRMWTNSDHYKTTTMFESEHLEGTCWVTLYTDDDGYLQFSVVNFLPSPTSIQ